MDATERRITPDDLRALISRAESMMADIHLWELQPREFLQIRDQIEDTFDNLADRGIDVRPERNRMRPIDIAIKGRGRDIIRGLARQGSIAGLRGQLKPSQSHWWWYLDLILQQEGRRRLLRTLRIMSVVLLIMLSGILILGRIGRKSAAYNAHIRGAQDLHREGKLEEALAELEKARQVDPDDPASYLLEGVILGDIEGREAEQKQAFEKAKGQYKEASEFYVTLAAVYWQVQKLDLALESAKEALEMSPKSATAHFVLGNIYASQGDKEKAIEEMQLAVQLSEDNPQIQVVAKIRLAELQGLPVGP